MAFSMTILSRANGQPGCELQNELNSAAGTVSREVSAGLLEFLRAHPFTRRELFQQGQSLTPLLAKTAQEFVLAPIWQPAPFEGSFW